MTNTERLPEDDGAADLINLIDAIMQLLDDMASGTCVSVAAKAQARIAIEPFIDPDEDIKDWMSLEEAKRIISEL